MFATARAAAEAHQHLCMLPAQGNRHILMSMISAYNQRGYGTEAVSNHSYAPFLPENLITQKSA
jgi:hypothetical protein